MGPPRSATTSTSLGAPSFFRHVSFPEWGVGLMVFRDAAADEITLVVQVTGKKRGEIQGPADVSDAEAQARALALDAVQRVLEGRAPKKVIVVKRRLF